MFYPSVTRHAASAGIASGLLAMALAAGMQAQAADAPASAKAEAAVVTSTRTETAPPIILVVNKSTILRLDVPATRISVGNPAVADITPINSREIIVLGKSIGSTNLIIWNKSGTTTMMDVNVTPEPVIAAPPPTPDQKDSVEVIKGLNRSKMEF